MPDLFDDQARRRPDVEQGVRIVYENEPDDCLPDGRYDGDGPWSREALFSKAKKRGSVADLTRREKAMLMLYREPGGITAKDFHNFCGSFRLAARIHELREMDETPPIEDRTKTVQARDGSEPTVKVYFIPKAD